jgi:hypothetical protein
MLESGCARIAPAPRPNERRQIVPVMREPASSLVPGEPWQEIKALGNRLRHEYDAPGGSPLRYRAS